VRLKLLFGGRMPDTSTLDHPWYNTPNIHLCTIRDFCALCADLNIKVERSYSITSGGKPSKVTQSLWLANLFADQGLFLLTFDGERDEDGAPVYPT
jgi:methionine biosynthesis protein MetW